MSTLHFENATPHELGYKLYPPRRTSEPGYARLEVLLRDEPSMYHFDPERVNFKIISPYGGMESLRITNPWAGPRFWQACVGPMELIDRKGKHVDLYIFGGEVSLDVSEDCTCLALASEAPIILPYTNYSVPSLFVQEVEIQLAQLRAEWCQKKGAFDNCLASLEPLELYRMCLVGVLERLQVLEQEGDRVLVKLLHILEAELVALGRPGVKLNDLEH